MLTIPARPSRPGSGPGGDPAFHRAGTTVLGPRRRRRPRRRRPLLAAVAVALVPLAGLGLLQLWPGYLPPPSATRLVVDGYACQSPALVDPAGRVLMPFWTVRALFAPGLTLEAETMTAVISTRGLTIPMASAQATEFVNRAPVDLRLPVTTDASGALYVPADFFAELLGFTFSYFPESNTVVIDRLGLTVETVTVVSSPAFLRETPSLLSLRVSRLEEGDVLRVYDHVGSWLYARDTLGRLGYIPKKATAPGPPVTNRREERPVTLPPLADRLCLVWEHVSTANPDPARIGEMPGVNVVSPTWLHVMNSDGDVYNNADTAYVAWAHERGYRVWGLVTNGFSRDRTRNFLPDPALREKIIRQLLIYARLYRLDGFNMDFENMYLDQKDDYVALLRELAAVARPEGLTLSVDVTFHSSSEVWSRCYDRAALAEVSDFVMVMGYDQHTAGSPVSGPVGSLPWVEAGLERVLEEVPASKLVLGVPFYTRLWAEEPGRRPTVTTYSMQGVQDLIAEKGLTPVWDAAAGQNYIEFSENGVRYRLWVEDEASMAARVTLVERYGLAGLAAWRRGFEVPEVWEVIRQGLGLPED